MSDVSLSAATQNALLSTLRTVALADQARDRLATGLKVNSPTDNAPAFFQAQALGGRAGDLLAVKSGINQSLSALGGAQIAIDAIADLTSQLKAIALSARNGTAAGRQAAAEQFDALRGQIDNLAADAGFGGTNLLASPPGDLTVSFNSSRTSSLTISGVASDAVSLGIVSAQAANNGFATEADIDNALSQLSAAVSTLNGAASTLGSNAGLLNTRLDFTHSLANQLLAGAAKLAGADLNEEAAKLLSLKLTQERNFIGLSITTENQRAVLELL